MSTAEVQEIVDPQVEKPSLPSAEENPPEPVEEVVEKPSMEFDQIGFEIREFTKCSGVFGICFRGAHCFEKNSRIYSEVQGIKMPTEDEVMTAVNQLNESYEKEGRSFRIKSWGRGIRMASHPQYANYIRALYQDNKPKKLSRTLMETLSIIAYSQPTPSRKLIM